VHSLDKANPLIAEARDLINLFLDEGEIWGPSVMMTRFAEGLEGAMNKIDHDTHNILGVYWEG
jgi:hypothetical protein